MGSRRPLDIVEQGALVVTLQQHHIEMAYSDCLGDLPCFISGTTSSHTTGRSILYIALATLKYASYSTSFGVRSS